MANTPILQLMHDAVGPINRIKQLIVLFKAGKISGNPEPAVKSPFSHLDTVTVKKQDVKKEKDGGVKSPFSGLDKK